MTLSLTDYGYLILVALGILHWLIAVALYLWNLMTGPEIRERPKDITEDIARQIRFFDDQIDPRELIR